MVYSDHLFQMPQPALRADVIRERAQRGHLSLTCIKINRWVQHNLFEKVSKQTVAKLPSNSFSICAGYSYPRVVWKSETGVTYRHTGARALMTESMLYGLISSARFLLSSWGTAHPPWFMVNHSLTDIFAHAKMEADGGLRGKTSLVAFNKAYHKNTDTCREEKL